LALLGSGVRLAPAGSGRESFPRYEQYSGGKAKVKGEIEKFRNSATALIVWMAASLFGDDLSSNYEVGVQAIFPQSGIKSPQYVSDVTFDVPFAIIDSIKTRSIRRVRCVTELYARETASAVLLCPQPF
jgi:hypothetical protein